MLAKLLALLSTAKGAAAATVIAAAAVGTGVTATNHDVQNALKDAIENVTERPAVVAARNDADKKLRDAFQTDQRKLEKLHDTKVDGTDRETLNKLANTADKALRDRLTKALDDVAALTLGRDGHDSDKSTSTSDKSTGESEKSTGSADVKLAFTTEAKAKVDLIVTTAITDMDKTVSDAQAAAAKLPAFTPGKRDDAGKPDEAGRTADGVKPEDVGGKPSNVPTPRPTR